MDVLEFDGLHYSAASLYAQSLESWEELWNWDKSLVLNIESILNELILIQKPEIQLRMAAIYLCASSKLSFHFPVLYCYGQRGAGKSTIASLAVRFRGRNILIGATNTFASIRNELNQITWFDLETKTREREGILLAYDNLRHSTFSQAPYIYQMLLQGYDRNSGVISIASEGGENLDFSTYGPKIINSVDNFFSGAHIELERRLMPIFHNRIDELIKRDIYSPEKIESFLEDKVEIDSFSWNGFHEPYFDFWQNKNHVDDYVLARNLLTKRKSPFKKQWKTSPELWTISVDLICSAYALKLFNSLGLAIDFFQEYWNFVENKKQENTSNLLELIQELISSELGSQVVNRNFLLSQGHNVAPLILSAATLKGGLKEWEKNGLLPKRASAEEVAEIMGKLGWKLTTKGWALE